jgi:hypothetical protein
MRAHRPDLIRKEFLYPSSGQEAEHTKSDAVIRGGRIGAAALGEPITTKKRE